MAAMSALGLIRGVSSDSGGELGSRCPKATPVPKSQHMV